MLSPGPGKPADFDLSRTIELMLGRKVPLFGVCLGLQGMVEHFGGSLGVLSYPQHGKPGSVRLTGRQVTLIEAIGAAGGHLKDTANLRNTVLIRRIRGSNEMRSWRLDADVYGWGDQPAVFLQARDVAFVPNTAIDENIQ